ncbi:MAG: hypothetical protein OCC45_02905 [Desulfotalea sp.]
MSNYKIEKKDIELLSNQGMKSEDLEHSLQVAEKRLKLEVE